MNRKIVIILCLFLAIPLSQLQSFGENREKQLLKIFHSSPQEKLKKTRWDDGSTTVSNESRLELFYPYLFNTRGGYVGIGGTQNFLLASWANAEWVWLMDFTSRVVAANKIQIVFLKESKTPKDFLSLWKYKNRRKALKAIKKYYPTRKHYRYMKSSYRLSRYYMNWRFKKLRVLTKKRNYKIWLNEQYLYNRIRNLALKNRIIALKGNLYGSRTMRGIGARAKKMGVIVRTVYLSNAEEYMVRYTANFRKNILSLPYDSTSWLFRTTSARKWLFPWSPDSKICSSRGFHYNVTKSHDFSQWLTKGNRYVRVFTTMNDGIIAGSKGFSIAKGPQLELHKKFLKKKKKKKKIKK